MKHSTTLCILAMILLFACNETIDKKAESTEPIFNEEVETAAIMQVISNETDCFFNGDYNCWATNWKHAPYAMQAWNNDDGTYSAAIGWDSINAQGKRWIQMYYANGKNIIHPLIKKEKPIVKFFNEKVAYLIWKQYNADKDKKYYSISHETRLMEKDADGWKIVNVTAMWNSKTKIPSDSLKLP